VKLATSVAMDLPALAAMRTGLRDRMKKSPLTDSVGFVRGIETAYRDMWRNWCARGQ
jgi:protein O-GlcNAc transferase